MKLKGASAITRIALNPECGVQVAMLRSGVSEPTFYRRITGKEYEAEYGERLSARRRGLKFERNAFANDAAKLREALSPIIGIPPADMWVRNLDDEEPGARDDSRIRRWRRTMEIIADHIAGRPSAHILIQPQLRITAAGLIDRPGFWIAPDIVFVEHASAMYRPADLKSFVVRGHQVEPGDLERSRLQVAIQSIALHEALKASGDQRALTHVGGFIFATPYGLSPHAPQMEVLDGSVDRVQKALSALRKHGRHLDDLKSADGGPRDDSLLETIPIHFQERCIGTCVLAGECRKRHQGRSQELGDAAVQLLGPEITLDRAFALMTGARPKTAAERAVATVLIALNQPFRDIERAA